MKRIFGWAAALTLILAGAAQADGFLWNETPFAHGPVYVVAPVSGKLRTYKLVPCRNGTRICAGSGHGRAGQLTAAGDGYLVRGAYGGIAFELSANGDGVAHRGNRTVPLAWAHQRPDH